MEVVFELDCLLIGKAVESLHKLLCRGAKARIVIPVTFTTVQERSFRERYLNLCREVPPSYKRFILFHLHGPMASTPVSRLTEIGVALKAYSEGVIIEAAPSQLQEITASSFHGVSLNAKNLPANVPEATDRLLRLVGTVQAVGVRTFVHGADSMGLVEACINAGVDYVEGRGVALPLDEPKPAYQYNPRNSLA